MADADVPSETEVSRESLFLRIDETEFGGNRREVATLVEIVPSGRIPREVGLAADGTPTYVTRPGEYGIWNDSPIPYPPMGTPDFDMNWRHMGTPISREEFERVYAAADAILPHTFGGTPIWLSRLAGCAIVLVALAVVVGVIAAAIRIVGRVLGTQ